MRSARGRMLLAATALGVAASVAACGSGSTTTGAGTAGAAAGGAATQPSTAASLGMNASIGPAATGAHNAADVAFATEMISHHGQAVQMSHVVLAGSGSATTKALAQRITSAQAPEIAAMSGWLKGWGAPVPDPYATMSDDMGGMAMNGSMSTAQLHELETADGPAADRVFLTLMPDHHRGAIAASRAELADGANPEAKALAQSIITSQTAEIDEMKTLLSALG